MTFAERTTSHAGMSQLVISPSYGFGSSEKPRPAIVIRRSGRRHSCNRGDLAVRCQIADAWVTMIPIQMRNACPVCAVITGNVSDDDALCSIGPANRCGW